MSAAHESDFTYDGLSRLARIVDKNAGKVTADRAFVWCGAGRCAAHDNLQPSSPVSTRYFGQGVVDGGVSYYYVRDRLGSVRQLVDASGKVRAQYDYDPYGNRTKLAGDLDSDVGYAGYFHHVADSTVNGLDFALYRAYDARHGRWLNRDPIGEAGGTNLYAYVGSNPVNARDPSGLLTLTAGVNATAAIQFLGIDGGIQLEVGGYVDTDTMGYRGHTSTSYINDDNGLGAEAGFGLTYGGYEDLASFAGRGTMYSFDAWGGEGINAQLNFDPSGDLAGPSFGPAFGLEAGIFHWQNDTDVYSIVSGHCKPLAPRGYALSPSQVLQWFSPENPDMKFMPLVES